MPRLPWNRAILTEQALKKGPAEIKREK